MNQSNLGDYTRNRELTFEDYQRIYDSPSHYCGKRGYIFSPMHTEQRIIRAAATWIPEHETVQPVFNDGTTITTKYKPRKIEYPFETELVTIPDQLIPAPCKKISCSNCRESIVRSRHNTITQLVNQYELNNHLILTFPGNQLRKSMSLRQAYDLFVKEKHKLDLRINYAIKKINSGKKLRSKNEFLKKETHTFRGDTEIITQHQLPSEFLQISMLRAQSGKHKKTDTDADQLLGYPHYHILTNTNINNEWITEITKKNEFKIGFSYINPNQNVVDYLAKDFYYDDEWKIPFGHRHINTSRGITLNLSTVPLQHSKYYNTQDLNIIEADLTKQGYHVPHENYIQSFVKINNED